MKVKPPWKYIINQEDRAVSVFLTTMELMIDLVTVERLEPMLVETRVANNNNNNNINNQDKEFNNRKLVHLHGPLMRNFLNSNNNSSNKLHRCMVDNFNQKKPKWEAHLLDQDLSHLSSTLETHQEENHQDHCGENQMKSKAEWHI